MKSLLDRLIAVRSNIRFFEGVGDVAAARRIVRGVYRSYFADEREILKQERQRKVKPVELPKFSVTPAVNPKRRLKHKIMARLGFKSGKSFRRYAKDERNSARA